jgi:hypothetical protein
MWLACVAGWLGWLAAGVASLAALAKWPVLKKNEEKPRNQLCGNNAMSAAICEKAHQ